MKVLYVINSLGFGGAETQLFNLVFNVKKHGVVPFVVILHSCEQSHIDKFKEIDVCVKNLGMTRGVPDPRFILKLREIFLSINPDVIHSHIYQANVISRLANWGKYRLISTAHNIREGGTVTDFLYRWTDWLSDITTNVSQEAVERYNSDKLVGNNRCVFLRNGVDTSYFSEEKVEAHGVRGIFSMPELPLFIAVGRLCEQKNYALMLKVISKINANLLIVGDGEDKDKISEIVSSEGLEGKVKLFGTISDVRPLYKDADYLLMTSLWEGLPIVLLEAMAMKLPVISTNVSGAGEVLPKYNTGLLLDSFDAEKIADQIKLYLKDVEYEDQAFCARKAIVEDYSMAAVSSSWVHMYEKVTA